MSHMDPYPPATVEKHAKFHAFTTPYKTVRSHDITCDVLISKDGPLNSPRPVLVKIHGGGLITGSSSFLGWFAPWIFDYALLHQAIIVSPNHRLMPEANGLDILEDMNDFFDWLHTDLQAYITSKIPGVEADLTKVLVQGDSAGAYLSILSALHQKPHRINSVIAAYPFLDFDDPHYYSATSPSKTSLPVFNAPLLPPTILAEHIASLPSDGSAIITSADPPSRLHLLLSMTQQGLLVKLMGDSKLLYPFRILEDLSGTVGKGNVADVPRIFIYHGRVDSAVPAVGTERFVEKVRTMQDGGDERVFMRIVEGADHGFDVEPTVDLQTQWLSEGLAWLTPSWVGGKV